MSEELKKEIDLKKLINENSNKKIFILSGENSYFKTGAEIFLNRLIDKNKRKIFLKKKKLPEFEELKKIILDLNSYNPDIIIAVGGGCVMDLAKISSNLKDSKNLEEDVLKSKLTKNKIKVIAIPTTAGSGAEVTSNAVIYLKNLKYSVEGEAIRPDYFYLLPELLSSSSQYLDATACFDAISQSVESLFSVKSNKESILYSKKSLKYSFKFEKSSDQIKNLGLFIFFLKIETALLI